MHIVHVASELAPIAKVGGLADVVLGLSRELSRKGHDVDVIIPKYDCLDSNEVRDLHIDYHDLLITYQGETFHNTIWKGWVENLKVYFVEPHHPKYFFNRGCFYGCRDDIERFTYFSLAAHEFLRKKGRWPDILHLHDWQTAPLAYFIRQNPDKDRSKIVLTIHNIDYQGKCQPKDLQAIGITEVAAFEDPKEAHLSNLLKGAILNADAITTVSPTYSCEVLHPKEGRGLDAVLRSVKHKFHGILNGIDYAFWNPETDRFLPAPFSPREIPLDKSDGATLDKKGYVKKILREKLGLSQTHSPIVGCIARLVPQKGIQLMKRALTRTLEKGGQFVLLGSSPIPEIAEEFHDLKQAYDDSSEAHFILHHQEDLAHLIYGGSDLFIIPSIFEPCGLTQMISLKYGTIPVVRKTGGLADTIQDIDHSKEPEEFRNGYVFDRPDDASLDAVLDRAIDTWYQNPERWRKLMIRGMNQDFSWGRSSEEYLTIYRNLKDSS
jgi:starch synthase